MTRMTCRYSADYVNEVVMSDMTLRPNATSGSKGKTYRFYTGRAVWCVSAFAVRV